MMKTSGYINKQGQNNIMGLAYWPQRFFTLENNAFTYYTDDSKNEVKGMYRLGKDDVVEVKDGVLSLTSTFYKNDDCFGNGSLQKLNMKLAKKSDLDAWHKTLRTVINYAGSLPHYTASCKCGVVECTIVGKCTSEVTCHCLDCSFYQGISPMILFPRGSLTITKGHDLSDITKSTRPNTSITRVFCKQCHTFCFAGMNAFNAVGVPYDRLCVGSSPKLSRSRTKFHLNYSSKRTVMKDGQTKYHDMPSSLGGSGNVLDDDGNFIRNDVLKESPKHAASTLRKDGSKPIALVTGGCRGIGREVCRQLSQKGYRVILSGRDETKAEKVAFDLRLEGLEVESLTMDTQSIDSVNAAVGLFATKSDRLDVLVNNVGDGFDFDYTASTVPLSQAQDAMDVNLFSAWRVTQAFTPFLQAGGRGTRIVMVGSGAGTFNDTSTGFGFNDVGNGTLSCHGVSKMALHALTVKFSLEFKDDGIMVNAVCPGFTDSAGTGTGRPVEKGASGVVTISMLAPDGPTGQLFRDGKQINF